MTKPKPRNGLANIHILTSDAFVRAEAARRSAASQPKPRRQTSSQKVLGKTRIQESVKKRQRLPPAVPKNKSMKEIHEMDPQSPELLVLTRSTGKTRGRPRKYRDHDGTLLVDPDTLSWRDRRKFDHQEQANDRRAKLRKYEAEVIAAYRELEHHVSQRDHNSMEVYDEDYAIAQGVLSMDDWDDEELIRGYRRNRNGRFGAPPKYIAREVQQEAFRRLVNRGERKMKEAYIKSVEGLIDLAHHASSEKVRLDAQRELLNRVIGKVPDKVLVAHEEPWEQMLADSMVPISEMPAIDMTTDDDGVARVTPDEPEAVDEPDIIEVDGHIIDVQGSGGVETSQPVRGNGRPRSRKAPSPEHLTTPPTDNMTPGDYTGVESSTIAKSSGQTHRKPYEKSKRSGKRGSPSPRT
jgi:hypothetical protein